MDHTIPKPGPVSDRGTTHVAVAGGDDDVGAQLLGDAQHGAADRVRRRVQRVHEHVHLSIDREVRHVRRAAQHGDFNVCRQPDAAHASQSA